MGVMDILEKQIPKKPNKTVDRSWGREKIANVCPVCDYYLGNYSFITPNYEHIGSMVTFCETCGTAIDWSEEDNEEENNEQDRRRLQD